MSDLNALYLERNQLVAALSKLFPASMERDIDTPEWPVCILELPTGQVSWHVHPDDVYLFAHLPTDAGRVWDGHSTPEKWARLNALTPVAASAEKRALRRVEELAALSEQHAADYRKDFEHGLKNPSRRPDEEGCHQYARAGLEIYSGQAEMLREALALAQEGQHHE